MRISDWSSDVCSSDLSFRGAAFSRVAPLVRSVARPSGKPCARASTIRSISAGGKCAPSTVCNRMEIRPPQASPTSQACASARSEEHTSELQSLMRISYAVFCLKKKKTHTATNDLSYMTRKKQRNKHVKYDHNCIQ